MHKLIARVDDMLTALRLERYVLEDLVRQQRAQTTT